MVKTSDLRCLGAVLRRLMGASGQFLIAVFRKLIIISGVFNICPRNGSNRLLFSENFNATPSEEKNHAY